MTNGKDSDSDELGSLGDELSNMNIDSDYNVWSSFRGSMLRMSTSGAGLDFDHTNVSKMNLQPVVEDNHNHDKNPNKLLEDQDRVWSQRWKREEIFSVRYKPSKEEKDELEAVDKSCSKKGMLKALKTSKPKRWDDLLHPRNPPYSILLKRSPCIWEAAQEGDGPSKREVEVILLTHGLLIATVSDGKKGFRKRPEKAIVWSEVDFVQPHPQDTEYSWQLLLKTETLSFTCSSHLQQQYWFKAFEQVLVEYRTRAENPVELGWQYRLVYKSAYTMAVTDDMDTSKPDKELLTHLDRHNGYTPLHYAVRCHRAKAVKALLKIGSNPNYPDGDGATSVDHAVRDSVPQVIIELLQKNGGIFRNDDKSALFGQVTAVAEKMEREKAEQEARELAQQKEAEEAKAKMAENMRLLQERGEKINELGDKAENLNNEAHEFRSMAGQLKQKMKKQSKWLLF